MKDLNEKVYILYSPDIVWNWDSNTYPPQDSPLFKWSPTFIPVKSINNKMEPYHVWMKMKVGKNDTWTNAMKIANPILITGEKGDKGLKGDTGDKGDKGNAGVSIEVEYADINKNPVSGTSNDVIFVRFKKDPITTSAWFKVVGSDAIMSATFPMGSNGQILSTNGVAALWIEKDDVYNNSDAQNAVINDSQINGSNITYSIDKLLTLFADGSLHNHDDRYYTETELDALFADASLHNHDDRYYTEIELDALFLTKKDTFIENTGFNLNLGTADGTVAVGNHLHDGVYYTETEVNALLDLYYTRVELNAGQLDTRYYTETEINNFLDNYYTQLELVTPGSALVHWDNLINVPTMLHDDTSSISNTGNTNFEVLQNLTFDTYGHVLTQSTLNLANTTKNLNGTLGIKIVARHEGNINIAYNPFASEIDSIDMKLDYDDLNIDSGHSNNPARNDHEHNLVYQKLIDSAKALDVIGDANASNVGTFKYVKDESNCSIGIYVSMETPSGGYEWYPIEERTISGCTPTE